MAVNKLKSVQAVYKDHIISTAENLIINCHHLASDLLDFAQNDSFLEPECAKKVSRQLGQWASQLAVTVETIRSYEPGRSACSAAPQRT